MADPYTTPVPGSSNVAGAYNAAKLAYDQALAKIGKNRTDLLRQAGYAADFDPASGQWSNLHVDGTSQYGHLQQLLRSHALEDQQAQYAAQDRGLHGGLANQAVSALQYEHGGQDAQFGQALAGDLGDLSQQQAGAKTEYDNALYEAQLEATRKAIADRLFAQANFSDVPDPTYGHSDSGMTDTTPMFDPAFRVDPPAAPEAPKPATTPAPARPLLPTTVAKGITRKPAPKPKQTVKAHARRGKVVQPYKRTKPAPKKKGHR